MVFYFINENLFLVCRLYIFEFFYGKVLIFVEILEFVVYFLIIFLEEELEIVKLLINIYYKYSVFFVNFLLVFFVIRVNNFVCRKLVILNNFFGLN